MVSMKSMRMGLVDISGAYMQIGPIQRDILYPIHEFQ